jgi:hypothetical protein
MARLLAGARSVVHAAGRSWQGNRVKELSDKGAEC